MAGNRPRTGRHGLGRNADDQGLTGTVRDSLPRRERRDAVKLLHAEELARYAGVHKSTVLLAIRRGELRASRTAGRSARIAYEDARTYLRGRNRPVPDEIAATEAPPRVAVITESSEVTSIVRSALPRGIELLDGDVYSALISVGAWNPQVVIVDLDLAFMNPMVVIRALRAASDLGPMRIVAAGLRDDLFSAARLAGADETLVKIDHKALGAAMAFATREAVAVAS